MKKQPKQARSQMIVGAVLDGATRVLSQVPLKNATTNKIAEVAGVGIGSLYDYFSNKNSIVNALIDRRVESVVADFKNILYQDSEKSLEQKIDDMVAFIESDFVTRRKFLKEIFYLVPESGKMEPIYRARVEVSHVLAQYLQKHMPDITRQQALQKSFMVIHGTLGIVESYIMIDPDYFSPEEFKKEVRQILRYFLLNPDSSMGS